VGKRASLTPSAPASAASRACSGVPIPNPSATGSSVEALARDTICAKASASDVRSPVVPATETA